MNAPITLPRGSPTYAERLAAIMPRVPEIKAIIAELYPGPIEMEIEEDPEIDGWRYLVFCVETRESLPEVAARHRRWHEKIERLLGRDFGDLVFLHEHIRE